MNIKSFIKKNYAKYVAWHYEHKYYSPNKQNVLKYLYWDGGSSTRLIVVFPSCWVGGAKYDYVSTLKNEHCHKIFLLDDSATNHRGNYLMGEDKKGLVISLLNDFISMHGITKTIFCGGSKGGTSAFYFSFFVPNVDLCIAAPQYYVGTYLNNETQWPNLTSILGCEPTEEKIGKLDKHIRETLFNSNVTPKSIHLLYSNKEHTYEEHIADMIADIKQRQIPLHETVLGFINHSETGIHFAPYLKEQLKKL